MEGREKVKQDCGIKDWPVVLTSLQLLLNSAINVSEVILLPVVMTHQKNQDPWTTAS